MKDPFRSGTRDHTEKPPQNLPFPSRIPSTCHISGMAPSKKTKRPARNTGNWSALRVLNSTSPIVTKDIHAFLGTCISGWAVNYTEAEKRAIIDSLPPQHRKYETDGDGLLICPITVDFMLEDPYVKAATAKFKRALADGLYEKGWQNEAGKAMQERRQGKFDAYLQEKTENAFGELGSDDNGVQDEAASSDGEWGAKGGKGRR